MELILPKPELTRIATLARAVIPRQTTLPVPSHARFEHAVGHVTALATNLDRTAIIPVADEASGSMHLSAPTEPTANRTKWPLSTRDS